MGQKLAALGGRPVPSNLACVCLDLDGTLLCSDHRCHPASVATLRKLHARGIQVMLCTGRSPSSLVEVLADLDLPDVPVVCMNGTAGFVFRTPPPLSALASHPMSFSVTLTPALIASVAAATGDDNLPLQLYSVRGEKRSSDEGGGAYTSCPLSLEAKHSVASERTRRRGCLLPLLMLLRCCFWSYPRTVARSLEQSSGVAASSAQREVPLLVLCGCLAARERRRLWARGVGAHTSAETDKISGCRGETPRTPPAAGDRGLQSWAAAASPL
jgi:hypothetical protein